MYPDQHSLPPLGYSYGAQIGQQCDWCDIAEPPTCPFARKSATAERPNANPRGREHERGSDSPLDPSQLHCAAAERSPWCFVCFSQIGVGISQYHSHASPFGILNKM